MSDLSNAQPLPDAPPSGSPEEIERAWLELTYVGDHVRQLTVRSVITGMILGGLLALSNLYVALKTGWSLGVTITAAILGFGFWSGVRRLFPRLAPFGPLENNAMQSVASAAGYMTGGGTVAAIPALMMLTNYHFRALDMMVWIGVLAFLGVFVAIPLKRQLVNVEQLRFPTGLASAETVQSLHAVGGESQHKARALGWASLFGAAVATAREGFKLLPEYVNLFGATAAQYTIKLEASFIMIGAGAIMGIRTGISLLAGAIVCYGVLSPWAHAQGAIAGPLTYRNIVSWSVWIGSSMMLTAGLLQFALGWAAVKRAFIDLARVFQPKRSATVDPLARIEVPTSWFAIGLLVFGPLSILLQNRLFQIPIWMGVLTLLLSLVIAIVAARTTGETDTTPSAAMGKLVQLIFGALHPGNITTNLMTAQATAGVALHASDLLTDLKSGYVLGGKPRHQFFAQFFGVAAGTLMVVPAYMLLVPDASVIGDKYPAPAAQAWGAVAKLLAQGIASVHPTARWGLAIGGVVGVALVLLERRFPSARRFLPSPLAFGLAFTMPAWNAISMALGAIIGFTLERKRPVLAALVVVPVASGLIAGESMLGVLINIANALLGRG